MTTQRTDHSSQITRLRSDPTLDHLLAADLLELHDQTGISLDHWQSARLFVEQLVGPVTPNGV